MTCMKSDFYLQYHESADKSKLHQSESSHGCYVPWMNSFPLINQWHLASKNHMGSLTKFWNTSTK